MYGNTEINFTGAKINTILFYTGIKAFKVYSSFMYHIVLSESCFVLFQCADHSLRVNLKSVVFKLFIPSTTSADIWLSKYHHYDQQ